MKKIIIPLSCLALFAACGDDVVKVTEKAEVSSVKKYKDLKKCEGKVIGEMVYVSEKEQVFACTEDGWITLNGEDGEKGAAGASCSGKSLKDGSGIEVTCGDEVVGTILNGEKGESGKQGAQGKSCTASTFEDGSGILVKCDGKVVGTLKNGVDGSDGSDGTDGTSCTVKANADIKGFDIYCDGKKTGSIKNGVDGGDGTSCSVSENVELGGFDAFCNGKKVGYIKDGVAGGNGTSCSVSAVEGGAQITCGGDDPVIVADGVNGTGCTAEENAENPAFITITCGTTSANIAKAYCGKTAYDPAKDYCENVEEGRVVGVCGDLKFDLAKKFCDTRDNQVYTFMKIDGVGEVMTQNLNYYKSQMGNKTWCGGGSNNASATSTSGDCAEYGRLYTWNVAMDGASDGGLGGEVQGICPDGWHLMNYNEATRIGDNADFSATKQNAGSVVSGTYRTGADMVWLPAVYEAHASYSDVYVYKVGDAVSVYSGNRGYSVRCVKTKSK